MAIHMMVSEAEAKQLGIPASISHNETVYMQTTFVGCVLSLGEHNGYDDSDFYAMVWDSVKGIELKIQYGTTRGWTYPNHAEIDATAEVKALHQAWVAENRRKAIAEAELERALMPVVGSKIKVIAGRKLPLGTIAEVFYFARDTYKTSSRYSSGHENILPFKYHADEYRIGVRLISGARVFLAAKNVEIIK